MSWSPSTIIDGGPCCSNMRRCSSPHDAVPAPGSARCQVNGPATVLAVGGAGRSAARSCSWSARASVPGPTGTGSPTRVEDRRA